MTSIAPTEGAGYGLVRGTAKGYRLETSYSSLEWSPDGTTVTKRRPAAGKARFTNELRVNRLLLDQALPVPTPALVGHDVQSRRLTFEAVAGEPLGPKYPTDLSPAAIDGMLHIATTLRPFQPRRRWMRRVALARRFQLAGRHGLLAPKQVAELAALASRQTRLAFAHGDLTARNVLGSGDVLTLIDWEWAGLYPIGYELAFLWFSLVDVDGGRERVETASDIDETPFLLSALAIQLWHLQWYLAEFREKHLATRDALLARLGVG